MVVVSAFALGAATFIHVGTGIGTGTGIRGMREVAPCYHQALTG